MKSMKKMNYLFLMVFSLAFVACEDDEAVVDTERPNISLTAPTGTEEVFADDQVNVRANVTDNLGLREVTISVTPPGGEPQVVHTEEVRDFLNDNTTADIDEDVSLATAGTIATAGNYTITVRAVDVRGNEESRSVTVTVIEADDEAPIIGAITSPTAGEEFLRGEDITIASTIQENMMLNSVRVIITSGGTEWYNETIEGEDLGDDPTTYVVNETVTIPDTAPIGTHTITIEAEDMRGNPATAQTVNITVDQAAGE